MNNLYKKIDMATVVSFDIFDTLLLRPFCDPKDVFAYIEQKYNKVGFKKERILAEKRARKKKTEVTIEDIYFEMPMFSECQEIELDVEKQYLYKNEEVSELYKYAQLKNKKIVIVSDIYLHEMFISEVLDKNGYTGYEKLYISCEYQRTKNDGSLFDVVLNDYPLNENQIIHIGDNVTSDYIQPKRHGIIGINIPKVVDRYFQFRSFRSKDAETLFGSVFVKMCADRLRQGYDNYWHRFGFEFAGPVCFAFSKWIFDSLAKPNSEISDICFVARDGYLLKSVFEIINHDLGGKTFEVHYLYAPRIMAILCRLSSEGNIAGLDDKQKRSLMEYVKNHSENKCDDITGSAQCASLDEQIEKNIFAIMSISKDECSEYSGYIKSENLKGKKIAIVDSRTENFSAQRLLETVLDEKIFGLYYVVGEDNNQYQYSSYQKERQNLLLCWQIIEYILSAPTPSIQAIRDGGPVFGEYNTYEKERIEIFKYIEKGVIEFTNLLKKRTLLECSINEEIIRNWINNFSLYGDKTDREMFADLKFANNPNHTEYMDLTVFMDKKENINYREKLFRWLTLHPDLYAKVRAIYRWLKK